MFHIGQQVVCIKRGPWCRDADGVLHNDGPKFGDVVTISRFHENGCGYLVLAEWEDYRSFNPTRFRPVKKTDISVFTALLNPTRQKEKA